MAYTAGNWVQLAGVSDDKLREIAVNYLKDNYASAGYSNANHSDAWKLIHEESVGGESRTPAARMARIEAMRAEALKRKGVNNDDINKSYDLAIAYWGMRNELMDEREKANELVSSSNETLKPYILPSLSERMKESSERVSYVGASDTRSTIPAGKWRSLADSSFKKQQDEATAARRAAMSPLEAAIDEAPAVNQAKIQALINASLDKSTRDGVTDSAITLRRLYSDLKMKDKEEGIWFGDSVADIATRTVRRAEKIAAELSTDIFTKPVPEQAVETQAAEPAATTESPAVAATQAAGGAGGQGSVARKRPVQKQYTRIDPAVQLALERLGMDTGQPGTDGPNQFDTTGGSTPDGKRGKFTNQAIEDFRASKHEYKDLSEEELFAEIIKAGDAAYAAKGAGEGQTTGGAGATTETTTPPDLTAQLATQLEAVADKSDTAKDYRVFGFAQKDEDVLKFFLASFVDEKTGKSSLTAEQIESVLVTNGIISSPFIGIAERMLGMTQDNKMDSRLETALKDETVKAAVIEAFTGTTVSGGTATDVASASVAGAGNVATPPGR